MDSYPLMKNLDVSFCHINDIEDDAFGRLEILTTLNMHNNNLSKIPSILPSRLVFLNLKNNRIMDINPSNLAQLPNLQMLDLSGNRIMYIPGLPLPKLITLNVRSANVKRLSQSVVKMSPKLKDIFLDNNPVRCSELLSIAEWATPCRIYKIDDTIFDHKEEYIAQTMDGLNLNRFCEQPIFANYNITLKSSGTNIDTKKNESFEVKEFQKSMHMQKLESNMDAAISKSSTDNPHQSLGTYTINERSIKNDINPDDVDSNYLQKINSAANGITESLNRYGAIHKYSYTLAFLIITTGICFLMYIVYLYRCNTKHNRHCIETEKCIDIAHLNVERVKTVIHKQPEMPDDLW